MRQQVHFRVINKKEPRILHPLVRLYDCFVIPLSSNKITQKDQSK